MSRESSSEITDEAQKVLSLRSCRSLTDLAFVGLAERGWVEEEGVAGYDGEGYETPREGEEEATSKCRINEIDLSGTNVAYSALDWIAAACHDLVTIKLSGCKSVQDSGVSRLWESCPKIRHVDLDGTQRVSYRAFVHSSPAPELEQLNLRNCSGIGDKGLELISKLAPSLKFLDLVGLHRITDAGISSIASGCAAELEHVNISGRYKVANIGLASYAR